MPRFPGVDYLQFDSLLSEQELLVRQTARQFVDEQAQPLFRDALTPALFPASLSHKWGSLVSSAPIWKAMAAPA